MGSLNPSSVQVEVTLRKFTLADMKFCHKWFGDDEVTATTPNDTIRSEEDLEHYFATTIANHPWYRLICVNGVPAGAVYLTMGSGAHAVRGDLSYILAKEHWGKGVVTVAAKMAVEAGFKEFHLARIQAYTLTHNIGSQRVLGKCGFQREGLLRNFVKIRGTVVSVFVYAIYQDADMI
ncbi:hypothetical protein KC19_4G199100 [Ceratodon purpureus]|uniref:N-acetyltransferase domain-containing protein n=1 Tax=Ceratodon purpureus TaxID=3225 RepID=A0A8T0ID18_CERPU|nr:hypothetical protein KC19_4G199100 [Ceratodon purpureus]